ncbi:hypothetical protein [Mesorhizobium sp.]|uniref:hypothetical protein n=1 Tax=Mesorhizobium sp. TaxID=1871066 RepID=UPI003BA8935A
MTRAIVIDFDTSPEDADLNFKIWIFAEDLYRALKSNELASLPLGEVDRVASRLVIPVHSKKKVRRASVLIDHLLETHFLTAVANLSIVDGHSQVVE